MKLTVVLLIALFILAGMLIVPGGKMATSVNMPVAHPNDSVEYFENATPNTYTFSVSTLTSKLGSGGDYTESWTGPQTLSAGKTYNGTFTFAYLSQMSMKPGYNTVEALASVGVVYGNLSYAGTVYVWQHTFDQTLSTLDTFNNLSIAPNWTVSPSPAQSTAKVNITVTFYGTEWSTPPADVITQISTKHGINKFYSDVGSFHDTPSAIAFVWGYYTKYAYTTTFTESGLPSGFTWVWYVNITATGFSDHIASNAPSLQTNLPNGTYTYSVASENKLYAPNSTPGTVTVDAADQTVSVPFHLVVYTVTFTESGLPSATEWFVNLTNGQKFNSTTTTISFTEPNATYDYTVANTNASYLPSSYPGVFTVDGSNIAITIKFSDNQHTVFFNETGLPSGTKWSVTLNGSTKSGTTTSISFLELNGTYPFTIGNVAFYVAFPVTGSVTVAGKNVTQDIVFKFGYSVIFNAQGLKPGIKWSVTLNGSTISSYQHTITIMSVNGTYAWNVTLIRYYIISPSSGTVKVDGANVTVNITFTEVYIVTFAESGLPSGSQWSLTMNNQVYSSTTNTIVLTVLPGTIYVSMIGIDGYYINPIAWNNFIARNQTVNVTFSPAPTNPGALFDTWDALILLLVVGVPLLSYIVIRTMRKR